MRFGSTTATSKLVLPSSGCRPKPFCGNRARLRCFGFLDEVVVTGGAEAMRQTTRNGIDPACISIGFFAEPALLPCLSIVMHQPTEMTDQKHGGVRSGVRSGHITSLGAMKADVIKRRWPTSTCHRRTIDSHRRDRRAARRVRHCTHRSRSRG